MLSHGSVAQSAGLGDKTRRGTEGAGQHFQMLPPWVAVTGAVFPQSVCVCVCVWWGGCALSQDREKSTPGEIVEGETYFEPE